MTIKTAGRAARSSCEAPDLVNVLCQAISAISSMEDADEALRTGLETLVVLLGASVSALAFLSDGDGLVLAARAGDRSVALGQIRLCSSDGALTEGLGDGASVVLTVAAQVAEWMARLTAESRADLAAVLGQAAPSSLLCVPLRSGPTQLGCIILAGHGGARMLGSADVPVAQAVADLVATAVDRVNLQGVTEEARKAEEATKLKTEAISALSHQMRTPLASIKGYATALLLQGAEYDDATWHEFLQAIDEEADRLSGLIADLLESSAIEAGLLDIEYEPVLLPRLANDIVREMAQHNPDHKLLVSFPSGFPVLHADPGRIEQVLHNLLDNAVKYSPDGGLVVLRGIVAADEVVVSVADQGVGIAPEHLNRLFERFFRIKGNLRRPVSGTGLGLPIARAIIEAHGGRIWAESAPGRGSTFYFTLPLSREEEDGE